MLQSCTMPYKGVYGSRFRIWVTGYGTRLETVVYHHRNSLGKAETRRCWKRTLAVEWQVNFALNDLGICRQSKYSGQPWPLYYGKVRWLRYCDLLILLSYNVVEALQAYQKMCFVTDYKQLNVDRERQMCCARIGSETGFHLFGALSSHDDDERRQTDNGMEFGL